MTEGTAIEFAEQKMRELGFGSNYLIRYRHYRLDQNEKRIIKGENHHFFLIGDPEVIKVKSRMGIFDLNDPGINELQHHHSGRIQIENLETETVSVRFIQAIPQQKKEE